MPAAYVSMRDKFIAQGMSGKAAKTKAARIYNAKHKDNPVTKDYDEKHEGHKLQRQRQMRSRR
jgi:hypothetical protein